MKKIILILLVSYFIVLLQKTFICFSLFSIPFLIIFLVILLSILESKKYSKSFDKIESSEWFAIFGGFFSDIFSSGFIGLRVFILLCLSLFIKIILRKYGMFPSHRSKQKKLF